jgi:hypothetical protein
MRVSSQASESTYVASRHEIVEIGAGGPRNLQAYERTRHQTEGGLMPLVDRLAAVEEPRWLALMNGGSYRLPRDGEIRRVTAIQARTLRRGPDSEST